MNLPGGLPFVLVLALAVPASARAETGYDLWLRYPPLGETARRDLQAQTGQPTRALDVAERPRVALRLLNHWDNLDGTIERGYAGPSLWSWEELPGRIDPRVAEKGRANVSIGVN